MSDSELNKLKNILYFENLVSSLLENSFIGTFYTQRSVSYSVSLWFEKISQHVCCENLKYSRANRQRQNLEDIFN